jgi:methylthioribose-1-phosphate isomerase
MNIPSPLIEERGIIRALDQRLLPQQEVYCEMNRLEDCHRFIADMVVRGAPLIGFTALWGMVVWLKKSHSNCANEYAKASSWLATARPTAVNLAYELNSSKDFLAPYFAEQATNEILVEKLESFTRERMAQLEQDNLTMAKLAETEMNALYGKRSYRVMTLCNTGYLACGPLGTALGVVSYLNSKGKVDHVFACETRPYLQGARLTAYELDKQGISHSLIVEGAISHVLKTQNIDAIFIGADRIAANGDTANKVGSSTLAICARHYGVPFFVVAPTSSFDTSLSSGDLIEIEMRPEEEITHRDGKRVTSIGTSAFNPSFDVTASEHIAGIFCEKGLIRPSMGADNLCNIVKGV